MGSIAEGEAEGQFGKVLAASELDEVAAETGKGFAGIGVNDAIERSPLGDGQLVDDKLLAATA